MLIIFSLMSQQHWLNLGLMNTFLEEMVSWLSTLVRSGDGKESFANILTLKLVVVMNEKRIYILHLAYNDLPHWPKCLLMNTFFSGGGELAIKISKTEVR